MFAVSSNQWFRWLGGCKEKETKCGVDDGF